MARLSMAWCKSSGSPAAYILLCITFPLVHIDHGQERLRQYERDEEEDKSGSYGARAICNDCNDGRSDEAGRLVRDAVQCKESGFFVRWDQASEERP